MHAEATNSTTIRFTWNAPSPQFINGINQGYKVREVSPGPGWKPARRTRARDEGSRQGRVQEGVPAVSEITGSGQAGDMHVIKAEGLGLSPSPRPGPREYGP